MQGVAINFVKNDDIRILRDIEQYYSTQIDEMVRQPPCGFLSPTLYSSRVAGALLLRTPGGFLETLGHDTFLRQ